jgi:hypothetical protein
MLSSIISYPDEENRAKSEVKQICRSKKGALTPPDYLLGVKSQACDKIAAKGATLPVFCRY